MLQAVMFMGSIVLGAGIIMTLVVWIHRLSACDPFDVDGECG